MSKVVSGLKAPLYLTYVQVADIKALFLRKVIQHRTEIGVIGVGLAERMAAQL